jgi:hypothetical protein
LGNVTIVLAGQKGSSQEQFGKDTPDTPEIGRRTILVRAQ